MKGISNINSKQTLSWHEITGAPLLYDFYEGLEYEVPHLGRVWIERRDLEALAVFGGNPKCHLQCHNLTGRVMPVWVLMWFE